MQTDVAVGADAGYVTTIGVSSFPVKLTRCLDLGRPTDV
jgi:hypothetical protein